MKTTAQEDHQKVREAITYALDKTSEEEAREREASLPKNGYRILKAKTSSRYSEPTDRPPNFLRTFLAFALITALIFFIAGTFSGLIP
ncbi:MAG: hypothetical protein AAGC74_02915 [Verrucomicrobiota bacterium]